MGLSEAHNQLSYNNLKSVDHASSFLSDQSLDLKREREWFTSAVLKQMVDNNFSTQI